MKSEGKINEDGGLEIRRAGHFKEMRCKQGGYDPDGYFINCDHFCPKFGEPMAEENMTMGVGLPVASLTGRTLLPICDHEILKFDEFTDERVADKPTRSRSELI